MRANIWNAPSDLTDRRRAPPPRLRVAEWVDARLNRLDAGQIARTIIILWTAVIAADYSTSPQLSFTLFYLVPISVAAWYHGWRSGLAMAIVGSIAWLIGDVINGIESTSQLVRYWNVAVRGGIFLVDAYSVAMLRHVLDHERELARTDSLTGVSNWRHFSELAARELSRARRHHLPITLAYIDVDNFKNINDTAGHDVGNAVLREIADALGSTFRLTDVIARVGGDEFVVLLPDQDEFGAEFAINKARQQLLGVASRYNNAIGFSIGVVTAIVPPPSIEALVQRADALMYEVKAEGKSGCRFAKYAGDVERNGRAS